jgi:iron(III) transport system substrate-binding protein
MRAGIHLVFFRSQISMSVRFSRFVLLLLIFALLGLLPVAAQSPETLTVYSGRNENLIGPLLDRFTADTGVEVRVLYGDTAAVANQIMAEGTGSPADVYIAQDGGALGALAEVGLLARLPSDVTERVNNPGFVSPDSLWVGLSGRARVLAYNPVLVEDLGIELPDSILDLTGEEYRGLVGWAPTNGSFQANVTGMRVLLGDEVTRDWLEAMTANNPVVFSNNTAMNQGIIDGEAVMGLTNHYYMFRFLAETPDAPLALHFFPGGDAGSLINIAGAAVLESSDQKGLAQRLILYMLGSEAQQYFADSTFEYPVIDGIEINPLLPPLSEIEAPDIDLSRLSDLQTTLDMIEDSGALDS